MTSKIKILHVIKTFNLGGAETNLFNLVRAFDLEKVENHIAFSTGGEIEERFRREDLRLFRYAAHDHKIKSLATLAIVWRLAQYIKKNGIDIVHTHNFNAHLWGLWAAKLAGAKVVEHVHDFRYLDLDEFTRRRGTVFQFRYIRYFKNTSDRVVVLTRQNVTYLTQHGFYPAQKIREIKNGIPLESREYDALAVRSKWKIPSDSPVVFTSARMSPEKNIDLILKVAPEVIRQIPNVRFVISGDGPLLEGLKKECAASGIEANVYFPGFYQDIHEFLSIADVYWLPSFLELHSIAILEALSMKVAALVSQQVGCNSDVLTDGKDAVLRDPFKVEGWAEALIGLLKDKERRSAIAENGYQLCRKRFDIRMVAQQFEDLYAELVSRT
jgi:glycosyltransferase involved in cell wall biosynthesis